MIASTKTNERKEKKKMNQEKLKKYVLQGSFHTLTVKSTGLIAQGNKEFEEVFKSKINSDGNSSITINLNKINGDLFTFREFTDTFEMLRNSLDIDNYRFLRADFRLDSYNAKHYSEFAKLNKYLISAMALTYNVKNCYKTDNLFSHKQLSIAIKNDYFQLENYDRNAKSKNTENHNEPAQARLEERTMAREFRKNYGDASGASGMEILQQEFTEKWFERWDKALNNLDAVGLRYNEELERIYKQGKDAFPVKFRTLTDFLIQYQDCIFSRKQLINLLERFPEVKNPKERAKSHKKRYGIEYIAKKDAKAAVEEIKRATLHYFSGDEKEGEDVPFLENKQQSFE